jgi:hypothetical protein
MKISDKSGIDDFEWRKNFDVVENGELYISRKSG